VGWTFVYLMVILKLPIAALFYIVWRAIKDVDEAAEQRVDGDDGGSKTPSLPGRPSSPRRRGPHGEPTLPAPPRSRTPAVGRERAAGRD